MKTQATPLFNNQAHAPIIPWVGGKRRLAKHILPLFPAHTCYVEPFCGAAALYFMKEQAKVEVINDINGVDFGLDQYTRMAELAKSIKGRIIISVNDIPEMRQAFAGLHMESVDITYTVGGGKKGSKTAELVIRNWR